MIEVSIVTSQTSFATTVSPFVSRPSTHTQFILLLLQTTMSSPPSSTDTKTQQKPRKKAQKRKADVDLSEDLPIAPPSYASAVGNKRQSLAPVPLPIAFREGVNSVTKKLAQTLELMDFSYLLKKHTATAVRDFLRFMVIKSELSDVNAVKVSPGETVDAVWHDCILNTNMYRTLCAVFLPSGQIFEHNPEGADESDALQRQVRLSVASALSTCLFVQDAASPESYPQYSAINPPPVVHPIPWGCTSPPHRASSPVSHSDDTSSPYGGLAPRVPYGGPAPQVPYDPTSPGPATYAVRHAFSPSSPCLMPALSLPPAAASMININVHTTSGKIIEFVIEQGCTTASLKQKIFDAEGISIKSQRVIFVGKQLEDRRTMRSYGIKNESNLFLVMNLSGC